MIRDERRRTRRPSKVSAPAVESLERRQLLSFYTGPTTSRPVFSKRAVSTVTVIGGGVETVRNLRNGQVAITLYGTGPSSTLLITQQTGRPHFQVAPLQVAEINVKTGLLGAIQASGADLVGSVTPLNNAVSSLQFNSVGQNAKIDVNGGLNGLSLGGVDLGPNGHIHAGGLGGTSSLGAVTLDGGTIAIDSDVGGTLNIGSLTIQRGGLLSIGHDVSGSIQAGNVTLSTNGQFVVGHDVSSLAVSQAMNLSGGRLLVANDVSGNITVGEGLSVSDRGLLAVGRNLNGSLMVTGDLSLDSGGNVTVGRDLAALNVTGNLTFTPSAGAVVVGGNLNSLAINGQYQGKGTASTDLAVGLNLNGFTVLGGGAGKGGVQGANIGVAKDITGLDILHGIFNSLITAGVLIDGLPQNTSAGGNIGPDGSDAVFDSQVRAGVQIKNLTINGDVRSDYVTNAQPSGYRTRIVAGEDRQGNFTSGGNIDNFQITGALIDSVIAASVAPNGGNGMLPLTGSVYGAPPPAFNNTPGDFGNDTYDAPAGMIVGGTFTGTVVNRVPFLNYSEVSYFNETPTGVAYNHAIDPTIDDTILPGAINASFASPPAVPLPNSSVPINIALPTKSTVPGGVISTPHGDSQDFAGIFAADTRGVFVGTLPQQSSGG